METKVNLAEKLALLDAPFQPGIVGTLNDYKLAVVKVHGEFVWHAHDDTDDFFLVLSGHLTIQLRDRNVELDAGELFVVPRGVEHCPRADEPAEVLLIEPEGTVNTGDAGGERTAPERRQDLEHAHIARRGVPRAVIERGSPGCASWSCWSPSSLH